MRTSTFAKSRCSKNDYATGRFLSKNINIYLPRLGRLYISRSVYIPALQNHLCRIYLCRGAIRPQQWASKRRNRIFISQYVYYSTNCTEKLLYKSLTHTQLHFVILLSSTTALWPSLSAEIQLRHAQPGFLSTSSSSGMHSMYCRKNYSVPPRSVWEFRQKSSSTFPRTTKIPPYHRQQLAQNNVALFCSVRICHKRALAEPDSKTTVHYR